MNRRVLLNILTFTVASALMVGWALSNVVSVDRLEKPYPLSVELANTFGVGENAEVTYLGVKFGSIDGVERVPGGAVADLRIERDKRIPAGSVAHVLRKSVIGEPYIDFAPPEGYTGDDGPFYEAGARIPQERTTVPLEFSELLRSADALLASVPPEDVTTLLHEASVALNGRAPSLRALAEAGDRLSGTLASRSEALDRLATNNTRLTRVVTEHRSSLGRSLTDVREIAETLKTSSGDTTALLDKGSDLMRRLADLVAKHKGNLDCDLKTLELLGDHTTTPERLRGLAALLDIGPRAYAGVWDSTDLDEDGNLWVRVGFVSQEQVPPQQYTPPRELPAAPTVEPCASPLRPVGVAGSADRGDRADPAGGGSTLPATGGASVVMAGFGVLAAALGARRVRLRSRG
ncbi:MAG: MCE family protein [Actinobacteria bacterium]|nr:MCE family protein [Actinomycetota bacterium]